MYTLENVTALIDHEASATTSYNLVPSEATSSFITPFIINIKYGFIAAFEHSHSLLLLRCDTIEDGGRASSALREAGLIEGY